MQIENYFTQTLRIFQFLLLLIIISCRSTSDNKVTSDAAFITVDDNPITAEEFLYSFNKSYQTNQDSISAEDINEYLKLFINYKLKVAEAKQNKYDTSASLKKELDHYQEQVKSSYRTTEKILDTLVNEAYNRMQHEIKASHILLLLNENAPPEDTLRVYKRLMEIRSQNEDFNILAKKYSEDPSAKTNEGNLGYFSAMQMVYPFETAAYNTPVGKISMPVRTKFGYHLIKVHDKRSVVRLSLDKIAIPAKEKDADNKIFEIHEMLLKGMPYEQVMSSSYAGDYNLTHEFIPPQQVNQLDPKIFEMVKNLEAPGDISDPVKTDDSWSIFILNEKQQLPPLSNIENQLKRMVRSTERLKFHEDQYVKQLLEKYNFTPIVSKSNIPAALKGKEDPKIFLLGGKEYFLTDFTGAFNLEREFENEEVIQQYEDFVKDEAIALEDSAAINANPELKWLLKEYEEGMLLFAIMEDSIWNKAVKDTVGLNKFAALEKMNTNTENNTFENRGKVIAAYQEYLEQQWVDRLRQNHKVVINEKVLEKIYEKLID